MLAKCRCSHFDVHFFVFSYSRETNLKARQCEDVTNQLGQNETALSQFSGHIVCEAPNNNLSRYVCVLQ